MLICWILLLFLFVALFMLFVFFCVSRLRDHRWDAYTDSGPFHTFLSLGVPVLLLHVLMCTRARLPINNMLRFQLNSTCPNNISLSLIAVCHSVILDNVLQDDHCNTNAPYWLDLQGQASPSPGRQIQVLACGHDPLGCCYWNVSAIMRNCGEYFVYRLKPVDGCHEAYCAQIQE